MPGEAILLFGTQVTGAPSARAASGVPRSRPLGQTGREAWPALLSRRFLIPEPNRGVKPLLKHRDKTSEGILGRVTGQKDVPPGGCCCPEEACGLRVLAASGPVPVLPGARLVRGGTSPSPVASQDPAQSEEPPAPAPAPGLEGTSGRRLRFHLESFTESTSYTHNYKRIRIDKNIFFP